MKKGIKIGLGLTAALIGVVALTSCTQSFCSPTDSARIMYAFEPGVTKYKKGTSSFEFKEYDFETMTEGATTILTINGAEKLVASWSVEADGFTFSEAVDGVKDLVYLNELTRAVRDAGKYALYDNEYYSRMDQLVFTRIFNQEYEARGKVAFTLDFSGDTIVDGQLVKCADHLTFDAIISKYSHLKFIENDGTAMWGNYDKFAAKVRSDMSDPNKLPGSDFMNSYRAKFNGYASTYRTCLTTREGKYGSYGYDAQGIYVNAKTWGYAWSKGFFEGLLVFPIGWLIDQVVGGFSNMGMSSGGAAFLGIVIITLIVRSLMLIATFKQTTSSAKMTELQPEIQKIQNKYPNSNTSQVEKQRMAEEMQRLYKKNKINPFTSLIVMVVQFPVFICVWGALSGSSYLTSGSILGLNLSMGIKDVLFVAGNWGPAGNYAAVTALFLFLLMAGAQTVSMLLPQWIQKAKAKKVAKLGKNPAQNTQSKQMKIFTYVMLAMIIFMGFSLVSAMGIYWFVGAVFSVIQTLITQYFMGRKAKKK